MLTPEQEREIRKLQIERSCDLHIVEDLEDGAIEVTIEGERLVIDRWGDRHPPSQPPKGGI